MNAFSTCLPSFYPIYPFLYLGIGVQYCLCCRKQCHLPMMSEYDTPCSNSTSQKHLHVSSQANSKSIGQLSLHIELNLVAKQPLEWVETKLKHEQNQHQKLIQRWHFKFNKPDCCSSLATSFTPLQLKVKDYIHP